MLGWFKTPLSTIIEASYLPPKKLWLSHVKSPYSIPNREILDVSTSASGRPSLWSHSQGPGRTTKAALPQKYGTYGMWGVMYLYINK